MKKRKETNKVIFHHSLSNEATVEQVTEWHQARGFKTIGYHYLIQKDGSIDEGRAIDYTGAHTKGRNRDTIGVCVVGDFRAYEPSEEQYNACVFLWSELCKKYGKPLQVDFHREEENPCPGLLFDRKKLIELCIELDNEKKSEPVTSKFDERKWWQKLLDWLKSLA